MAAKALTSKSLKTNNLGGFMEVKYKLVPVEPNDEQQLAGAHAIRIETTPINKMFTANRGYRDMIAAIPDQPSDLEIVQKALNKSKGSMNLYSDGSSSVYVDDDEGFAGLREYDFNDTESLLTWAKQQIEGVE